MQGIVQLFVGDPHGFVAADLDVKNRPTDRNLVRDQRWFTHIYHLYYYVIFLLLLLLVTIYYYYYILLYSLYIIITSYYLLLLLYTIIYYI